MADPSPARIEDVLAHAGWLRALAASLVRDPAAADDLVQETWLAAIESPPGGDRPIRPWLATVLRNLWRERHRRDERRDRRELAAARPERSSLPSPEVLAARLETQRHLADLVARLEEPFRSTVLLRFHEGVSLVEIARRTGTPEGTVRWRLHRALELLREQLDRENRGDRKAWALLLAPIAGEVGTSPGVPTVGSATVTGGLIAMGTGAKVTLAAAACLVAVALLWQGRGSGERGPGPAEGNRPIAAVPQAPPPITAVPAPPPPSESAPPGPAVPAPGGVPTLKRVPAVVSGRVLDTSGQPLPGARLLLRNPADDARLPPTDVLARASGDGTFRMEVSLPDRSAWRFAGGRPLFTTEFIASAAARETLVRSIDFERDRDLALGDIVLKPGGSVLGRVLDPEGAPVEGAWVAVEDPAHAAVPEAERRLLSRKTLTRGVPAASDATGAFVLEGLPVGPARVWAGKPGFRGGRSALLEIGAGVEVRGADIRIEPERNEDRVEGRVLAPDGSVVSNADFNGMVVAPGRMHTAQFEEGIRNRADGSFSIPVHFPATYNVLVLDTYGRWGAACATSLRPGDRSVEIRFPEARRATLRVRNAAGEPVPSWHAHLDHATADLGLSFFGVRPGVHPGGAAEFLVPGFPFQIDLKSEGFLPMTLGPFDPAALPEPIEAVLAPIPGLRGRVLSGGRPLAGARVLALRVVQPGSKYVKDGLPMRWYDEDPEAEAKTAEDGTFTIPVKNPAKSVLRAEYPGLASAESGPLSAGEAEGVEIRLGKGGTLEGRVLLPPGRSPDGTIVAAHRGDNSPRSMRVGADGRYRFEGLTPGPWMLQEHEFLVPAMRGSAYSPGQSEFPWACTVVEGQAVTCDLDRSSEIGATLRGRVTAGGSGGAPGWSASLLPEGAWFQQAAAGPVTVARDGTFELVAPRAGSWRVLLTASEGGLRIFDPVPIADGETAWNLEVSFGRIEGTVQPGALVSCVVEEAGGRWSVVQGTADAEGRFVLPRVPAGRARLAIVDPAHRPAESDPRRWPARSEIDVKAGETTTL